jgi:hypothetical protein
MGTDLQELVMIRTFQSLLQGKQLPYQ